ncbi:MAG: hypothetical protein OEX22_13055 [Cyclobacteriaceae bacterium]|nr:hypothetical protein [Cyclobacteriaceae bacterium]
MERRNIAIISGRSSGSSKRVTKAQKFSNHQLTTEQLFGTNWVTTREAVNSKYSMWLLRFMCGSLQDTMRTLRMHHYDHKDLKI